MILVNKESAQLALRAATEGSDRERIARRGDLIGERRTGHAPGTETTRRRRGGGMSRTGMSRWVLIHGRRIGIGNREATLVRGERTGARAGAMVNMTIDEKTDMKMGVRTAASMIAKIAERIDEEIDAGSAAKMTWKAHVGMAMRDTLMMSSGAVMTERGG